MPIAQNGRGAQRVVYVDEQGVEHIILLAMLGDSIVWDGHVHQSLQVPVAKAFATAFPPHVVAGVNMSSPVAEAFAEMGTVVVSASSTASPFAATASASMWVPIVNASHNLVLPAATATAAMHTPELAVVFGVIAPTMTADAVMQLPQIIADANLNIALGEAYAVMHGPTVGSYAFVSVPTATAAALMQAPAIHADANLTSVPATAAAKMWVPGALAGVTVSAPTATATATAHVPEVRSATILAQRMVLDTFYKIGPASNQWYQVEPGWKSNPTYPSTVLSGNTMQVTGTGTVTVTVNWILDTTFSRETQVRVKRNGSVILTGPDRTSDATFTETATGVAVTEGDLLTVEARINGNYNNIYVMDGSYLHISP